LTKTRRKKRILQEQEKRERREKLTQEGRRLGFKTGEEYLLWKTLDGEGIKAKHNVEILGKEVDLFIMPNLIIEVGFLDDYEKMKHETFKKHGYNILHFPNELIYNKEILRKHTVEMIKRAVSSSSFVINMHDR
jgi:very-short-patch-repair endonuclease